MFKLFSDPKVDDHQNTSVGLGLSYCKEVISKLNGQITCKSRVNVGTTFSFTIGAQKRPEDRGLSKSEDLSLQFQIAKLIQNNFVPLGKDEVDDEMSNSSQ